MRKIVFYILLYNVFCLIQFSFSKYINIYTIYPNFLLIFVTYIGFLKGSTDAQLMGFLLGLTWDVFSIDVFGSRTILFTIVGHFVGVFNKDFDKDKIFTQLIVMSFVYIVYWLGFNFIHYIVHDSSNNYTFAFINICCDIVRFIITVFISPVVFYILDRTYKGT
jgi:rod shape-determining protein MreD